MALICILCIIYRVYVGTLSKHLAVTQFRIGGYKAHVIYAEGLEEALPYIKTGLIKSSGLLAATNDIIIDVAHTRSEFIRDEMDGVSGETSDGHLMHLVVNTASEMWKSAVEGTVAHEYAHVVRFQTAGTGKGDLAESIVTEGLAQCFEETATGVLRSWSQAITVSQAKEILTKIKNRLDERSWDFHNRLFFSTDDKEFPHWSGYTISYLLVKKRLPDPDNIDWNEMVKSPPEILLGDCIL